jgi:predicted transcriptional regulator of viral defense system
MKKRLGRLESQFFAYAQMRKMTLVKAGDIRQPLGLSQVQEIELFRRLTRGGIVARVRPGLYLIPDRLPLGGAWTPTEIQALNALLGDQKGSYQICGPNAFNRYGYDEQIPNRTYAYNNRISGDRKVGSIHFTLIKVSDQRLGEVEEVRTLEGDAGFYSSRTRTLLDAIYDWSRFNTLPRAYVWIEKELASKRVKASRLVDATLKYGDVGTVRRMGFFLERIGVPDSSLIKLRRSLKPTTAFIPSHPNAPRRGRLNRRWGILDNGDW